jgi:ankyrin repeat protein
MVLPDAQKVIQLGLLPLDGGALSYYSQTSCFVKCGYGDTDYVDAYLEQSQLHPDELKLTDGCTLFILAASNGDNQMVYFLLEKGADPFVKDKNGFTAFHYASQSKYRSTCDLINEWNIDILVEAIKEGNTDKVKALLENEVLANKPDSKGVMPLYVAVEKQVGEIVDLLLKQNVNPLTTEFEGKKVLTLAKEMGNPGIIEALYSKSLLAAAKQNDLVLVQEIFQELEPVPTELCNTALSNAVFANQVEVARFLLDNGANPNSKANNGNVIFDSIVYTDSLEMAQLFLSKGADLSIKMQNEDTLLMGAERDGSPQMVQLMTEHLQENLLTSTKAGNEAGIRQWIEAGANPNIPGKNGELPLCVASGFGIEACVRVLLELGANPTVQDGKGKNALDAAKEKYQVEIEDMLERNLRIKGDFSRKIVQENIAADNQRITGFEK